MKANILKNTHIVLHFEVIDKLGRTWYYRMYKDDNHSIKNISPIGLPANVRVPYYVNKFALNFFRNNGIVKVAC